MLLFVGSLAFTPVYLFDYKVVPELLVLKESYNSFDQTAQRIVDSKPVR